MKSVVLHGIDDIRIEEFAIDEELGPEDVRIRPSFVGVCGSDVHYYKYGRIGPFVVDKPMVLGHEASGIVLECGSEVSHLSPGDRVCMEPGIPDSRSRISRLGRYNIDPAVQFWATPPVHGCLRETVVHPADFTFKVPDSVDLRYAAMVEPLAIGVYAAARARIQPGDIALIHGAGTIGMTTVMGALAAGCSRVIISDVLDTKLGIAEGLGAVTAVNPLKENLAEVVADVTDGWGADIIFEASGSPKVFENLFDPLQPGGRVVLIGMPQGTVGLDVAAAQVKEADLLPIFRYAHMYPRTIGLLASGAINLEPMLSRTFGLEQSIDALDLAARNEPDVVKILIDME